MKLIKRVMILLFVAGVAVTTLGCQDKGPAEKAGEEAGAKIDSMLNKARTAAHDISTKLDREMKQAEEDTK